MERLIFIDDEDSLRTHSADWPAYRGMVSVDTETSGLDPRTDQLLFVQLKFGDGPNFIIDARRVSPFELHVALKEVLRNPQQLKCFHNAAFDYGFLMAKLGLDTRRIYDSLLVEKMLTAGLNTDCTLKACVERYLEVALSKDLRRVFPLLGASSLPLREVLATPELEPALRELFPARFSDEAGLDVDGLYRDVLEYMATDTEVLQPLVLLQTRRLREHGMLAVAQLEFDVVPVLVEASLHGVLLNPERWRTHIDHLEERRQVLGAELEAALQPYIEAVRARTFAESEVEYYLTLASWEAYEAIREAEAQQVYDAELAASSSKGTARKAYQAYKRDCPNPVTKPKVPQHGAGPINLDSPVQLRAALEEMGVELPTNDAGTLETDRHALESVQAEHPIAATLLEYRGLAKMVAAFGEAVLKYMDEGNRLHPEFNQLVSTGRMSARHPNVQQIPANEIGKEFRECFVAPEGYKLVAADYGSMELRILAQMSREERLLDAFRRGLDLHSATTMAMYKFDDCTVEEVKDRHPHERKKVKTFVFARLYGSGPQGLAAQMGITLAEAKDIMEKYDATHPRVRRWSEATREGALADGWTTTLLGRKRFYPPLGPEPDRKSRVYPEWARRRGGIARQAGNAPIQGTNADVTKMAIVAFRKAVFERDLPAIAVLFVHDEVVVEVRTDKADEVADLLVSCMKTEAEKLLTDVPVTVDCQVGDWWIH